MKPIGVPSSSSSSQPHQRHSLTVFPSHQPHSNHQSHLFTTSTGSQGQSSPYRGLPSFSFLLATEDSREYVSRSGEETVTAHDFNLLKASAAFMGAQEDHYSHLLSEVENREGSPRLEIKGVN
eukprot:GHVN01060135.1.p1 GENE.GHVN01060135.1~~GHVN01060135.1.p1  ORF type:complete len:123 (-),score=29.28 GHVN01060135.1:26-394(-)